VEVMCLSQGITSDSLREHLTGQPQSIAAGKSLRLLRTSLACSRSRSSCLSKTSSSARYSGTYYTALHSLIFHHPYEPHDLYIRFASMHSFTYSALSSCACVLLNYTADTSDSSQAKQEAATAAVTVTAAAEPGIVPPRREIGESVSQSISQSVNPCT
jgi:hypothetical protein